METGEQQQKQKGPVLDTGETTQNTVTWAALDQSVVIAVCLLYLSALVCVALLVGGWVFLFLFLSMDL
jgi:hypothetical protein